MTEEFSHLLRETIGLDTASIGQASIERAVRHRVAACKATDPVAYLQLLRTTPGELQLLVEAVVVRETWFFRDPNAFPIVVEQARLARPRERQQFLCMPCSTGEEPYSLAIALLDAGVSPECFSIDAMDVSERALSVARAGIYGPNSFRSRDLAFRERYFHHTPDGFVLAPSVRELVKFHHRNLFDDAAMAIGRSSYDAIFCRNLLIYFDTEMQRRAITILERLLRPNGLFIVGPSETRVVSAHQFTDTRIPLAFAFRKGKPPSAQTLQPIRKRNAIPPAPKLRAAEKASPKAVLEKFTPTVNKVETAAPNDNLTEAVRLANEGRIAEVSAICNAFLEQYGPSTQAFYLLGLVSDIEGRGEEAAAHYRKALYLDPEHHDTLLHYSLLIAKRGNTAFAQTLRERANRSRNEVA